MSGSESDGSEDLSSPPPAPPPPPGLGLGLSLAMPAVSGNTLFEEENAAASCGVVRLLLQLDERAEMEAEFDVGQTVAFVKVRAMELFGFEETLAADPRNLLLSLPGSREELLDPMSLNDYAEFQRGGTVAVAAAATF